MEASPFCERQATIPSDAWYTYGSSRGQPTMWTFVAIQPETNMIWFVTGVVKVVSEKNCEPCGLWLQMKHCPYLHRYLGSVLGIMLWISTWHANQCMVMHRPLWGQALWQDLWELGLQNQITVHHVTRHAPASPGNDDTDTLAKVQWLETVPSSQSRK